MSILKKFAACALATTTMIVSNVTASAEYWNLNYTKGAPSSVSSYFRRREFIGASSSSVMNFKFNVTTGSILYSTSGFSNNANGEVKYASESGNALFYNPNPISCSITITANADRVVANGSFDL